MSWIMTMHLLGATVEQASQQLVDKGLDSAVSFAQSLSQWAYITIGASVAMLLKDFDKRPESGVVRWSFLLFLPGWASLAWSIYKGVRVHEGYIAYLMSPQHNVLAAILNINADAASQVTALTFGLAIFFVWLVLYLFWWIRHRDEPGSA